MAGLRPYSKIDIVAESCVFNKQLPLACYYTPAQFLNQAVGSLLPKLRNKIAEFLKKYFYIIFSPPVSDLVR